ncbi:hypothetical protein Tco_1429271 [Tanacetum coccineum]
MNPVATQHVALDNSVVAPEKRLKLKNLSPCYPAFLITAEVPGVYMHQFWNTIQKIKDTDAYRFKLDKKKFRVDTEVFREILQIFPRLHNQEFVKPPSEEELVTFIQELGYSGKLPVSKLKTRDNKYHAKKERMPYPRFTKVIINHFISKDKSISMRNRINLHTIRDDSLLGTLKFVSKTQDYQLYGALIPDDMINQDIKDSKAYKTYYDFATRKDTPMKARNYKKVASPFRKLSPVLEEEHVEKPKRAKKPVKNSTTMPIAGVAIRDTPRVSVPKKKTPVKVDRRKGMDLLSYATLLEAAQGKETLQKSKKDSHMLYASGSDEGTGAKSGVPDVPKYLSKSENELCGDSGDDGRNDDDSDEVMKDDDEDDVNEDKEASDSKKTNSNEDKNLNVNQNDDDEEEHEEEYVCTPDSFKFNDELYKDVDVKSLDVEREKERKGDAEMTDVDKNVSQERSFSIRKEESVSYQALGA